LYNNKTDIEVSSVEYINNVIELVDSAESIIGFGEQGNSMHFISQKKVN